MTTVIIVWIVAIVIGVALWQRFTRPPVGDPLLAPRKDAEVRRVFPLWLVLVLFILLVIALWVTLRWLSASGGAP